LQEIKKIIFWLKKNEEKLKNEEEIVIQFLGKKIQKKMTFSSCRN